MSEKWAERHYSKRSGAYRRKAKAIKRRGWVVELAEKWANK